MSIERERAEKLYLYANGHMRDKPTADIPDAWAYWAGVKNYATYITHGDLQGGYQVDRWIERDKKEPTE